MARFFSRKRKATFGRRFPAKRGRFTRRKPIAWTRKPRRRRTRRVKQPTRTFIVRIVTYLKAVHLNTLLHTWNPGLSTSVPTSLYDSFEKAKEDYEQVRIVYFKRTIRRNVPETLTGSGTESKYNVYTAYDPDSQGKRWVETENNFLQNQRTRFQIVAPFGSTTAFLRPRFARAPGGSNAWSGKQSGLLWVDTGHTKAFFPSSMNSIQQMHGGLSDSEDMGIWYELKFVCKGFKGTQVYIP